jgi:hypothetical protein
MVPYPHTLLSEMLQDSEWFTVLDLRHLFCIPLHPDSQFPFAFKDPNTWSSQLTWRPFLMVSGDTPNLFGQAPDKDLAPFTSLDNKVIEYVDNILLCALTKEMSQANTRNL